MDNSNLSSFYTGLLAVQITITTLIAAGFIALYQLHDKQTPRRTLGAIVSPLFMKGYAAYTAILIVCTSFLAWSIVGEHDLIKGEDLHINTVSSSAATTLTTVLATLVLSGAFFYILWQSRELLDPEAYLQKVAERFNLEQFADYLFHSYSTKPHGFIDVIVFTRKLQKTSKKSEGEARAAAAKAIETWEGRFAETSHVTNPMAQFVEYCRNNATKASGEVEKTGLPVLENLLIRFIGEADEDAQYVYPYIAEMTTDFKEAFAKSPIALRLRYISLLANVAVDLCNKKQFDAMLNVADNIHQFIRGSASEEIKIHAIKQLREVTDAYIEKQKRIKDWRKFADKFNELTLVVARIAESHYHTLDQLEPISIIENNRAEVNDFTSELVNYFAAYENIHERYSEIIPVIYFDAIDVSGEALIGAISRSRAISRDLGMTADKYHNAVNGLYSIFYEYARAAIISKNVDLLRASVFRMTRGIQFMKGKRVDHAQLDLADFLVTVGFRIAATPELAGQSSYGGTPLLDQIANTINENVDESSLARRKGSIEHVLFDVLYEDGAKKFASQLRAWRQEVRPW